MRGLVDQDLCKLHIICVYLHIFPAETEIMGQKCEFVHMQFVNVFLGMLHLLMRFNFYQMIINLLKLIFYTLIKQLMC